MPAPVAGKPLVVQEKIFKISLRAGFLSPGLQKTKITRGDELRFGPVDWLTPTYGAVLAEMWDVSWLVVFDSQDNRRKSLAMKIDPVVKHTGESLWNLWRHRHGYQFFHDRGYLWSSLEDVRPVMDPIHGAFFDEYLKNVCGFWVRKRLDDYLAGGDTTNGANWSSVPLEAVDRSLLEKPIRMKFSEQGLHGSYPVLFQINPWNVPVKIDFEMVRSTTAHSANPIMIARSYRWRYDMSEWRRRHGYEKNFIGDYEWAEGFPKKEKFAKSDGQLLDQMLDRCITYWVEVSVEQVMAGLNHQLREAMQETP